MVTKGYAEPVKASFASLLPHYLKHQKPRLRQRSYERTSGIVENQLRPFFGSMPMASIRRAEIQEYVTERAGQISAGGVTKELNVLKHLLGLALNGN
ncbi:N-terminal phage integrase SAM-like domain-containing protein [Acidisarcina polymorpha]|nr:N-terminal phage integrase SAM-like domain-containing protein [Acidisarcina polymorpha]